MAENLRFVETLDHSNFDKGIADSTAAVRKLAEDAELANKGIKGMFDTPAMKEAASTFNGVQKAVEGFTRAMSRDLPMKQELRETQKAAMQLEQIWRGLSDAEKQSAAGQELRSKIDMLIQRGGQLKDVMADVQRSMKFQASDTATLTATVQGIQALTAAAQVAAGAMSLLGMEQEDAMKVQKNLMAVLSVANGLQTIQNLLQKESALMMGLSAAKTSVLNAVTTAKIAIQKADTAATKATTAAQLAWNAAVSANPLGVAAVAIAGVVAIIYKLTAAETEATQRAKEMSDAYKQQTAQLAENVAKLKQLQMQWVSLTSENERIQWVKDNADEFKKLGIEVNNTSDAENALVRNTSNIIKSMELRARAAAAYSIAVKQIQRSMELEEEAANRRRNPSAWENFVGDMAAPFPWLGDKSTQMANNSADAIQRQADAAKEAAEDNLRLANSLNEEAAAFNKVSSASGGGKGGKRGASSAKQTTEKLIEGSFAWFTAEEQRWLELADKQTDYFSRQAMLQKAAAVAAERNLRFGDLRTGAVKIDPVRIADQINESLPKLSSKIKPMVIPVTFEDPVAAAKAKSDQLLKNTEGLRTAATAAAGAFRNLGSAIGGEAGKVVNVAGMLAQAIATMIQGYATATAQASSMGPWGWIAFALTGLAQLTAMVSTVKGFATGGIVGGTSYTGDRQYIRVNSGEMILNGQQQARLFNMINNGGGGGEVTFHIQGQQLVGVLNNYNSKMGKVR